jgi:hypothetical protein
MIPIVEHPSVVTSAIPLFKGVFSKPQKNNFPKYVSGLILSPNHTISYMNDLFYSHGDQTGLNNFITNSTWSEDDLDKARYKLIIEGLDEKEDGDAKGEGILIVDDSLARTPYWKVHRILRKLLRPFGGNVHSSS